MVLLARCRGIELDGPAAAFGEGGEEEFEGDAGIGNEDEGEGVVVFDSEDEDECEDLFAGTWDPEVAAKRRGRRVGARKREN